MNIFKKLTSFLSKQKDKRKLKKKKKKEINEIKQALKKDSKLKKTKRKEIEQIYKESNSKLGLTQKSIDRLDNLKNIDIDFSNITDSEFQRMLEWSRNNDWDEESDQLLKENFISALSSAYDTSEIEGFNDLMKRVQDLDTDKFIALFYTYDEFTIDFIYTFESEQDKIEKLSSILTRHYA